LQRFKVDLLVAQRIADANTQMKKQMLNLAAEVAGQDEQMEEVALSAEDELAGLFAHMETIGARLKDVKARCFKFESVTQQQMDTVYVLPFPAAGRDK
jgi:predicted Zn-dependent protease with MMP-like domain